MEEIRQAYNLWADQYDSNINRTRDLESIALRSVLSKLSFTSVLEMGCGTGKNSEWLVQRAEQVLAVDFSEEMLSKAKKKVGAKNIRFQQADLTQPWQFINSKFDLIVFSLVLEHIQYLEFIFQQVSDKIADNGYVYIGELHPYKQYLGSLARFDSEDKRIELKCFKHHVSEFLQLAKEHNFAIIDFKEWFDDEDNNTIPRIMTILLKKSKE